MTIPEQYTCLIRQPVDETGTAVGGCLSGQTVPNWLSLKTPSGYLIRRDYLDTFAGLIYGSKTYGKKFMRESV